MLEVLTPLNPRTVAAREHIVRENTEFGNDEILKKPNLGYVSCFINRPVNWKKPGAYVDFKNGYRDWLSRK